MWPEPESKVRLDDNFMYQYYFNNTYMKYRFSLHNGVFSNGFGSSAVPMTIQLILFLFNCVSNQNC